MAGIDTPDQVSESPFLLWGDCEFTGLPVEDGHKIIEIGVLVTRLSLEEVDTFSSFVKYDWEYIEGLMDINPWWDNRDADKLRMQTGISTGESPAVIDHMLASLTDEYFENTNPSLCGNSIHSDKKHIDVELPEFASRLSYQVIDVTSLKLIMQKYLNISYADKAHKHYAIDDVRESVDELRFLLQSLGIKDISNVIISNSKKN